ncbi:MAG: SDR family oxidoreductase [Bacteroidota bacterium]|nr:SDR family oxidoreductase [Bacteroidota bacterium]
MDTGIHQQLFLVGGAGSGFGKAIALALVAEGASVIAVARSADKLAELQKQAPGKIEPLALDLTEPESMGQILQQIGQRKLQGVLVNAGGPPAKTVLETTLEDWDNAYRQILRWKVALTQKLVPLMQSNGYGRLLFIESSSVKQPLENLVLSNSMRLAVVGFVKTLSQEIARSGITLNILAPGSHDTPAIERIYQKKASQTGISAAVAREQGIHAIPVGALGNADDFASLAVWLLSPAARYITGQTISVDGGMVKGVFG